jgi:predicted DNA-binding transcriptional regulator YafY
VPIEGEAGVGYRMRSGYTLPPLMFDAREAQALLACVRIALPRIDRALAAHAELALSKMMGVLPAAERAATDSLGLFAAPSGPNSVTLGHLEHLRVAIECRRSVQLGYRDLAGQLTQRVVRPLGCFYWGEVWTLAAWCELRGDFRSFRLDRIETLQTLDSVFRDEPGRSLADLLRQYACEGLD